MSDQDILLQMQKQLGRIESDITYIKETADKNRKESQKADEQQANKLEEYFDYAKKRQDSIKEGLEHRLDMVENKVVELEEKKGKTLVKWWDRLVDKLVWVFILAAVAVLLKWLNAPPEVVGAMK